MLASGIFNAWDRLESYLYTFLSILAVIAHFTVALYSPVTMRDLAQNFNEIS